MGDHCLEALHFSGKPNNLCTTVIGCIEVTYSGKLFPSDVNLYGVSGGTTGPDAFLDLTVEEGSTVRLATQPTGIGEALEVRVCGH